MKWYLEIDQIEELVSNNFYKPNGDIYQARCFSSDYGNNPNLPVLSMPGGDIGELAVFISAGLTYGFTIDWDIFMKVFLDLIKGKNSSTFNANKNHSLELCEYLNSMYNAPGDYGLDRNACNRLFELSSVLRPESSFKLSEKENTENACIIFEAEYGLFPNYTYDSDQGVVNAKILVFQKTFIDKRHRRLCKLLVETGAVKLFPGLDSDYLYEIVSETTENHLFETIKRLDRLLPVFYVSFSSSNKIAIKAY